MKLFDEVALSYPARLRLCSANRSVLVNLESRTLTQTRTRPIRVANVQGYLDLPRYLQERGFMACSTTTLVWSK